MIDCTTADTTKGKNFLLNIICIYFFLSILVGWLIGWMLSQCFVLRLNILGFDRSGLTFRLLALTEEERWGRRCCRPGLRGDAAVDAYHDF